MCAPCFKKKNPSPKPAPGPSPYELQLQIPVSQLSEKQKRHQLEGALHWGNTNRIEELLSEDTNFLSKPPSEFDTWLGEAISQGSQLEILEKLLAAGCDPNSGSKSPDNTTPLAIAVGDDRIDAIEWLLENGADPNISRPIVGAINSRKPAEIQLRMLTLLIDSGAHLNKTFALYGNEVDRFTVLDWAIRYDISPEVITFLKNQGAKRCEEL